jgi:hypothetical protein
MAKPARATWKKREREKLKQEKRMDKQERRDLKKTEKDDDDLSDEGIAEGEDPDIAGIIPGPQPVQYDD